jgi:hypothetical protein
MLRGAFPPVDFLAVCLVLAIGFSLIDHSSLLNLKKKRWKLLGSTRQPHRSIGNASHRRRHSSQRAARACSRRVVCCAAANSHPVRGSPKGAKALPSANMLRELKFCLIICSHDLTRIFNFAETTAERQALCHQPETCELQCRVPAMITHAGGGGWAADLLGVLARRFLFRFFWRGRMGLPPHHV